MRRRAEHHVDLHADRTSVSLHEAVRNREAEAYTVPRGPRALGKATATIVQCGDVICARALLKSEDPAVRRADFVLTEALGDSERSRPIDCSGRDPDEERVRLKPHRPRLT